ncbi:tryptophan 7-halogenase [Sphingomonas sp. LB-2]|uniref:tryptophan halogenase family protein n=1 Tax=Sphingomonas caeni TaxID=2984949 RepID=UPI002230A5B0|nr:tryptophan halogenase family protein [Sphingomonas caeni]MCW3847415.1 tryptophan 7-halogenase [Sphingomonas caeni]
MTEDRRISRIVVAGSGLVGLTAAAMLKRKIPGATVTLVGAAPADALSERLHATLPSIVGLHVDLGIEEAQVMMGTGAAFRLGTLFEGWNGKRPGYVHAYGEVGRTIGIAQFHQHWVRQAQKGKPAPYDSYSPAAMMARGSRFVHPQDDPNSPLSGFEYGLIVDPRGHVAMMRAFAQHVGVVERPVGIADVRLAADTGYVESLLLDDGSSIGGHLFVDCTGPAATIRSKLDDRFEDWSAWLPCDRAIFAEGPGAADPPTLDTATAHAAGWAWQCQSRASGSRGLVYSSAHLSDAEAGAMLPGTSVAFRSGRRSQPWFRNCVAIGDAAVTIDPLEWTNLHLAHSALDRLITKMPDRDWSPVELWDFNRECAAEAERARDFVALHYAAAERNEPFWRDAAAATPPDSLAHTLRLFRERGRLPLYEEETFTRHSWAAVLLGQGVMPRRVDPLIDLTPPDQSDRAMAQMREGIAAMIPNLPTQGAYMRQLSGASR